jgi:DNA-binding transcriptional MocR family regulator
MPREGALITWAMNVIRGSVADRTLSPGERVPSIRKLAASLFVSPSTVVEAYDRLAAEGLIRGQRGSGFYVSSTALAPLVIKDYRFHFNEAIDPLWVSRQSLDADADTLKPGCGWLPSEWMPVEALRKALRGLQRAQPLVLTEYGSTLGSTALRRLLLARLREDAIEASAGQLLLTTSGTHAVDLICRYLLRPGDKVLIDDPCYFNFRALLRAHAVSVVSVPMTPTGPDMDRFEAILATERPRLYLTNSAIHNPTGVTLSAHAAHRMLNAATAHDVVIVEDEIFADFEPEPSTRLATLDGLHRVIRIGSFSKTLSASVRCGYIAARADWIEDLVDLQVATGFGGPSPLAAELISQVLAGGGYRKHMEALRRRLARARRVTVERLQQVGIEPWVIPCGGPFLWCRLPSGHDSEVVARAALKERVVLAPGNVFSESGTASDFMRFNAAQCTDPRVMAALGRALRH